MEQEIKISISKKSLTYYVSCILIIIATFGTAYQLGKKSAKREAISETTNVTRASSGISHAEQRQPTIPTTSPTEDREGSLPESDTSWQDSLPSSTPKSSTPVNNEPIVETYRYYSTNNNSPEDSTTESLAEPEGEENTNDSRAFLASKNGKKYYPSSCKAADRIKAENRIYFSSAEEAELEGLTRTTACK